MKVFLMMALVLVVAMVVFPAGIQAQGRSPNARQAEVEARSRAWQRTQEDLQRGREETQRRMREAWQRNRVEARKQFDRALQRSQEVWQRAEENRAKNYSTRDRVYRPGEKHWSDPTPAQLGRDPGEDKASYGRWVYDLGVANDQLRREATERQRQAAAQRARNDAQLMGGPNYRPQTRTPATVRDGGSRDRDVPQRLSPASAAAIREIERQFTKAQNSTGRDTGGRSSGQSNQPRDKAARETRESKSNSGNVHDWQDRIRENMDRRNN